MTDRVRRFTTACIATPHHLASAAGLEILASGGNAVDAAVAANLVLGVVAPYFCGPGGDLFAIVADRDGVRRSIASNGRAPAGASVEQVRAAAGSDRMPTFGPLTVTVPGAIAGWFDLLDRHGTRSFGEVAHAAMGFAEDGFVVAEHGAASFQRGAERYGERDQWMRRFGGLSAGATLRQPDHAEMLRLLAEDGPDAFYRGPIGQDLVAELQRGGSAMTMEDLAGHEVVDVDPLGVAFDGREVLELPPPTQGVTASTALAVIERLGAYGADPDATHLQIEAVKAALVDRSDYVTDPDHMRVDPRDLLAPERVERLVDAIDPQHAVAWPPATPAPGGTAYLCAADGDGLSVSLINSHYMGFGSGVVLPTYGINTQNRGAHFSLDPRHVNVVAPGKRTLHTLIPAVALLEGRTELVFGTMGGDGQPQIHLQLLARLAAGEGLQRAISAPRWIVDPSDGSVRIESRAPSDLVDDLRRRGHDVTVVGPFEGGMGHAHAIRYERTGYAAATDPRADGAAFGF